MRTKIVTGLGFGDEGKGLTTDYLASKSNSALVVRSTGGPNAGHTVVKNDFRHVFTLLGSGTLSNAHTYWSKFCPFDPLGYVKEYNSLTGKITPLVYVDALAPVVTPFDVMANRILSKAGTTVGVGYGTTIQRHEDMHPLYYQDLFHPFILAVRMKAVKDYWRSRMDERMFQMAEDMMSSFKTAVSEAIYLTYMAREEEFFSKAEYEDIIFEGSQGILLDKDFGFFPNVTRGNTTSKNAMKIIKRNSLPLPEIYYITRAYQTRHGAGYMSNNDEVQLKNNEKETNIKGYWQGDFKTGVLDLELINYALGVDANFTCDCPKNLVITCLDQIGDEFVFYLEEKKQTGNLDLLLGNITTDFIEVLGSYGPDAQDIIVKKSLIEDVESFGR